MEEDAPCSGEAGAREGLDCALVEPGVWVGNYHAAVDGSLLRRCGVTAVLSCAPAMETPWPTKRRTEPDRLPFAAGQARAEPSPDQSPEPVGQWWSSFEHARVSWSDQPHPIAFNGIKGIKTGVAFIAAMRKQGRSVLVHCVGGQNRSTSMCVAWLMVHHGVSLAQAHRVVARKRSITKINAVYMAQLRRWEQVVAEQRRSLLSCDPDTSDGCVGDGGDDGDGDGGGGDEGDAAHTSAMSDRDA